MRLDKHILLIIMGCSLLVTGCRQKEEVDLIIKNAKIYTVNNSFSVVQSAAIRNGKFVAIGSDANILSRYTSDSIINLKGKFVYPGFIDSHAHFMQYALTLTQIDLDDAESMNAVLNRLSDYKKNNPGKWIVARNLTYSPPDDCIIQDNSVLDKVFGDTPVFIWTKDYKYALVNSEMLAKAGMSNAGNGGYLMGNEARRAAIYLPSPTNDELAQKVLLAERYCFDVGITSTSDLGATCANVQLLDSLYKTGCLQIPIYAALEPSAENIKHYIGRMPVKTDKLKVLAVSTDIDGRLSLHNSVMLQPDANGMNGRLRISADSLRNLCQMAFDHGFQMCVGCIGDSAARVALKTYADILPNKNAMRWRIENLHLIAKKDMKYFGHFNIIPSVQPTQYELNKPYMSDNLDRKLKKEVFAWKQLLGQNQGIVSGSNAPYGPLNPMEIMYAAMSQDKRKTHNKQSQKMTPTQVLKSLTIWGAYAQFDEQQKGSIEVDKWADFVVVGKNITTMYQPDLPQVVVEQTYLHGVRVK